MRGVDPRIAAEGVQAVIGPRDAAYGHPGDNLGRIAGLWSAYLGQGVTAHDVALMLVLTKVSRLRNSSHRDGYVDIVGYAVCAEAVSCEGSQNV